MTREQRYELVFEILAPYMGEEAARVYVERVQTEPEFRREQHRLIQKIGEETGIIPSSDIRHF